MEDIFTDSQVPRHTLSGSLKIVSLWILVMSSVLAQSQVLTSEDKKALKYYEKGQLEVKARQFSQAILSFQASIRKDSQFLEPYLRLASIYNLYQNKDSTLIYYKGYLNVAPDEKVNPVILRTVASLEFNFGRYEDSGNALKKYLSKAPAMETDPEIVLLRKSIEFAIRSLQSHTPKEINSLPRTINKWQLQYFPVLTGDSRTLIFTKRDSNTANADEDLVYSVLSDSGWTDAKSLSKTINTKLNEGAATVSADGRTLIFTSCDGRQSFGSCDLYITKKVGNFWSTPENLGSMINSDKWESQPSLSADGRTLYFSSNRSGGYGMRDIWVSKFTGTTWSRPQNLGREINTTLDETTPFIHANSQTLFYSSNGGIGMGGFDIYVAERDGQKWTGPRNLGYPYNTYRDEYSLFISSDGKEAFFSQELRSERTEIVQFNLTEDTLVKVKTSYVMGLVLDKETKKPLVASIEMSNISDSTDVYLVESDSVTGTYFLTLTEGKEYSVFASKREYLFEDFTYTTKSQAVLPDTIHIYLQPLKAGTTVILENIYFEFDKYDLKPESEAELKSIVDYLLINKDLRFMIEGHTDNLGASDYNINLSEMRAKAVYNFLLSHGIERNRMSYKGFGALVPIASNDTQDGQKLNRRIAFRVLR